MKQRLRISASKINSYENCPKILDYRYIQKLPEIEYDYFEYGKKVENGYYDLILNNKKPITPKNDIENCISKLYSNDKLKGLISGKNLTVQNEYKLIKCKDCKKWNKVPTGEWNIEKCSFCNSENLENYGLIGYSDIETEDKCIDIKTSSMKWTEKTVIDSKYQAMMYNFFNKKDFYFVIVNKKNFDVQILNVKIENFNPLFTKIEELRFAFDTNFFIKRPSWKCKFCSFENVCDKQAD